MCKLLNKTRELLKESKIPLERIAVDTGLSYAFVQKLKGASYSIPAVDKTETLYEYLSGKQLEL
jgi:hypothetical protein